MKKTFLMLAVVAMFFVSCHKEDPTPTQEVHLTYTYSDGITGRE